MPAMAANDGTNAGRAPDALPEVFGRYRVKKKLGGGGMGTVYLVENTELQRDEALKVPRFGADDDPEARERFLREARAAARLEHPNLCPVYHVGVQDGVHFLTMRYLRGKPLSDYTHQPQPPRTAVEIALQLAQALEYAHGQGVIHRDLKPSNVLMCAGVGPVVLDFGLAKELRQSERKLTQSGQILGTPAYMPPEQVQGQLDRIGPASDVYSLGVILYELLTGHEPFEGLSVAEVLVKVLYAEPLPPSALCPGLSPVLGAICLKALAKAPEQRYPSMTAFGAALAEYRRATRPKPADATPAPAQPRPVHDTAPVPGGDRPAPLDCTGAAGLSAAEVQQPQAVWAKYLGREVEEEDEIAPGVRMRFVLVPPGKFLMGSPEGEDRREADELLHPVAITRPFYLAKYEVTQAQYEAVLGKGHNPSTFPGADLPVESVTWTEAAAYADRLTERRGDGMTYRLPTEAEWEYACRGGRPSSRPFGVGDGTSLSSQHANCDGNYPYGGAARGPALRRTSCVGSYPPNAFGLHDLHGNVYEWCADWYGPYPAGVATDPAGPATGSARVVRGGSWRSAARLCRAADRYGVAPGERIYYLGFRLVRVLPGAGEYSGAGDGCVPARRSVG
jgi:formylglycine-generating enzyme required for sulfatase activity/predicted Ser/Thr protein kinase